MLLRADHIFVCILNSDDNDNLFSEIYNICQDVDGCNGWGNVTECFTNGDCIDSQSCNETSSSYDAFDCFLGGYIWNCVANPSCFVPFNATIFGFIQKCDSEKLFCSPLLFLNHKLNYCMSEDCSDADYASLWSTFYNLMFNSSDECVWEACGTVIDTCNSTLCREELYFVSNIEDTFRVSFHLFCVS